MNKWLNRLADVLKRLAGKAVEALPAIVGSVFGTILSFLGKAIGFVAEHTWALIVFVAGLIGAWSMQKVKKVDHLFFITHKGYENLFLIIIEYGRHPHNIQLFSC